MKKVLAFTLIFVLLLGLCACADPAVGQKADAEALAAAKAEGAAEAMAVAEAIDEAKAEGAAEAVAAMEAMAQEKPEEPKKPEAKITEHKTLQELNDKFHARLNAPAEDGVVNTGYRTVDYGTFNFAEFAFTVNRIECVERFSPLYDQDISTSGIAGKSVLDMKNNDFQTCKGDGRFVARWTNTDGQYVLEAVDDGAMTDEAFKEFAGKIREMCLENNSAKQQEIYQQMEGQYMDKTSQRATATVTAGTDCAEINVHWASSAKENTEWTMTVRRAEDGLLYYKDEVVKNNTYDDAGNLSSVVTRENGEGWWSFADGQLSWTGAQDEQCRQCVFEKMPANG